MATQLRKHRRRKSPHVHRDGFLAGETGDVAGDAGVYRAQAVPLKLREFNDSLEIIGGFYLAYPARDAAKIRKRVAQNKPDQRVIRIVGSEVLREQTIGFRAVEIVRIDDRKRLANDLGGHQDRVCRPPRLGAAGGRDETLGQLESVNLTQLGRIASLGEQRAAAVSERDQALAQLGEVNLVQQERLAALTAERDTLSAAQRAAKVKLEQTGAVHRQEIEALNAEHAGKSKALIALQADREQALRERDEAIALNARARDNHKRQLDALTEERDTIIEERDRALVRLERSSDSHKGDVGALALRSDSLRSEITAMGEKLKRSTAEQEELLSRLERLKDSNKKQVAELANERFTIVEERDKALIRLEKAEQEVAEIKATIEKERDYYLKEREKTFAVLDETRKARKEMESLLEENSPLAQELADAEKMLRGIAGDGAKSETVVRLGQLLAGLRSKLLRARQSTGEVAQLASLQLTPAEKLLSRHKYEVSGETPVDSATAVLRVRDVNIDRVVAMKVAGDNPDSRAAAIDQLIAEAQMIGRLEHPNIQSIHELSVDPKGRAFYTAKLMKGSSLTKILEDLKAKKNSAIVRFDLKRLLTVFHSVCDAVAFAHSEGIAHGHLSAQSVHVGEFGEVLVTGWEQAKTIRHENLGTYEADVRVDLAGLGELLFHILTLTPPVAGETKPQVKPAPGWKVPKGLWALMLRVLRDRAASAYPRVAQMQTEVEDFRDELGPRGGRASAFDLVKQTVEKWR